MRKKGIGFKLSCNALRCSLPCDVLYQAALKAKLKSAELTGVKRPADTVTVVSSRFPAATFTLAGREKFLRC